MGKGEEEEIARKAEYEMLNGEGREILDNLLGASLHVLNGNIGGRKRRVYIRRGPGKVDDRLCSRE